jgi:hypothetical protein
MNLSGTPRAAAQLSIEETLFRGLVWTFIGAIFAFLFVVFAEYLRNLVPMPLRIVGATVAAAALTSLFYGSMRLTAVVANCIFIVTLVYVWQKPAGFPMEPLLLIGASVGLLVGALYGALDKESRIFRADAKLVAGLFSGFSVAIPVALLAWFMGEIGYPWIVMLIAPLVVLVYVNSAYWFVNRCCGMLRPLGDGLIVGLGVGGVTALLFVIMAGNLNPELLSLDYHQPFVQRVHEVWGKTIGATAAVCFVVGVLRSILHVRWYDL